MPNSEQTSAILNFAADLFAASPRKTFTQEEVVHILRKLPDEVEYQLNLATAATTPGPERRA